MKHAHGTDGVARRAGRPNSVVLTPERIYRAALDLVDREGIERLTVTRLAEDLGVKAASLYHHVDGRAAVVEGLRHLVVSETDVSAFGQQPWSDALKSWARSLRDAFARHPHTIPLLATTTIRSQLTLQMYERAVESLEEAGWPDRIVVAVFTAVECFVIGSALDLAAPDTMIETGEHAAEVPHLATALAARVATPRAEEAFEVGLEAIVAGLQAQLIAVLGPPAGVQAGAQKGSKPTVRSGARTSRQGRARSS